MRQDACEYNVCVEALYMQIGPKGHCMASVEDINKKQERGHMAIPE
jgi:hypothetical protein